MSRLAPPVLPTGSDAVAERVRVMSLRLGSTGAAANTEEDGACPVSGFNEGATVGGIGGDSVDFRSKDGRETAGDVEPRECKADCTKERRFARDEDGEFVELVGLRAAEMVVGASLADRVRLPDGLVKEMEGEKNGFVVVVVVVVVVIVAVVAIPPNVDC